MIISMNGSMIAGYLYVCDVELTLFDYAQKLNPNDLYEPRAEL